MTPDSLAFLRELLDTPSPSGFEQDGQRVWLRRAASVADRTWHDAWGNCFAEVAPAKAADPITVAVCGHADEIGLMVNHIDDKGFVYCRSIGGIDAGSIVGKRLHFRSSVPGVASPVLGVIGATAIHLQEKTAEGKVRKLHELFIDIGASDRESAAAKLNIGDPAVFADGFAQLTDDIIVARGLDNRIGTWVAAETVRLVAEQRSKLRCRVVGVATVQEEVGLHGAEMIAESLRPDVALVTDVGHATDSPGISNAQHGLFRMGSGPKIAIGGPAHPAVVDRLLEVAQREEIPLQRSATPGRSGTDMDAIFHRAGGITSALVSLPIRYMHTTVETASLNDLERIAELFAAFCLRVGDGERFGHRFERAPVQSPSRSRKKVSRA
ncbi:MAG: M20/M25/M40 family metallo-hydrolase [Phycisphaerales bacterium]|nr:M20/M25/M40 family metallo-hydrolase [Phycisphaerales bacterium]